jgi:hypothetical protein
MQARVRHVDVQPAMRTRLSRGQAPTTTVMGLCRQRGDGVDNRLGQGAQSIRDVTASSDAAGDTQVMTPRREVIWPSTTSSGSRRTK